MHTFLQFKKVGFVKEDQIEYGSKILSTSDAVRAVIEILDLRSEVVETMNLIALDLKKNICGISAISRGTSTTTFASPKEIFRDALLHNAESIILIHNHPSGDSTPSANDIKVTKQMRLIGKLLAINLEDHIIVSGGTGEFQFRSIRDAYPEIWKPQTPANDQPKRRHHEQQENLLCQ